VPVLTVGGEGVLLGNGTLSSSSGLAYPSVSAAAWLAYRRPVRSMTVTASVRFDRSRPAAARAPQVGEQSPVVERQRYAVGEVGGARRSPWT
jgi:hypothetical protein